MNPGYDYLIVGAGLYGSVFARMGTDRGAKCLVIEKRDHTGGNLYCPEISGINVHAYGAHIFHTSDRKVWDFVNTIVPFNRFTNSPVAIAPDGNLYNLPINMNTLVRIWPGVTTPHQAQEVIESQRQEALEQMKALGITEPQNLKQQALALFGKDIFNLLIDGYTHKQWGRPCEDLPPFIIKRLPVRLTFDNNYFDDLYQGIPIGGYNRLINRLLEGSDVIVGVDFHKDRQHWKSQARKAVYTGAIDQYFDYDLGHLQYRSLRFETEVLNTPNYQGNAVVNYTASDVAYTRIIEHKHFESFGASVYHNPTTVITREYPCEWQLGMEPYYPINDHQNQALFAKYAARAEAEKDVIFGGRLAQYAYLDMAPVVANVMNLFEHDQLP